MKKIIILFATSLFLTCIKHVSGKTQQIQLGLKGGVNFSSLYMKHADDAKTLVGFNNGLFVRTQFAKKFLIQSELYYTTKGSNVTYKNAFTDGTAQFKFSYIELPLLLIVRITPYFNVQIGPYISFLIDSRVSNLSNANLFNYQKHINMSHFNKIDAGIALGVEVNIGVFSIGARYNYGAITVGKESVFLGNTYRFPNARNSVGTTYVSFSFN